MGVKEDTSKPTLRSARSSSQAHKLTSSQAHKLTSSQAHKLTSSQAHKLTSSKAQKPVLVDLRHVDFNEQQASDSAPSWRASHEASEDATWIETAEYLYSTCKDLQKRQCNGRPTLLYCTVLYCKVRAKASRPHFLQRVSSYAPQPSKSGKKYSAYERYCTSNSANSEHAHFIMGRQA
jgi:hypothetical protein